MKKKKLKGSPVTADSEKQGLDYDFGPQKERGQKQT